METEMQMAPQQTDTERFLNVLYVLVCLAEARGRADEAEVVPIPDGAVLGNDSATVNSCVDDVCVMSPRARAAAMAWAAIVGEHIRTMGLLRAAEERVMAEPEIGAIVDRLTGGAR